MIFNPDILAGRVALITGGGTGIGLGIATEMARCGADVCIASRKPEHLEPSVQQLQKLGCNAIALPANVRDPDSVKAMVQSTNDQLGHIDIFVNNAAGNFYAPSSALSPNGWKAVVETDLSGTFFCSQAVYPLMKAQGSGSIISISMTLHYRGWPMMAHATAAKAGVDALTRTLALEWAPAGIRVNAIAPGPVPTEGVRKAFTPPGKEQPDAVAMDEHVQRQIPLGRWGRPEDIANMAVYLSSAAADWITGSIFVVDGGSWLAR